MTASSDIRELEDLGYEPVVTILRKGIGDSAGHRVLVHGHERWEPSDMVISVSAAIGLLYRATVASIIGAITAGELRDEDFDAAEHWRVFSAWLLQVVAISAEAAEEEDRDEG